MGAPTQAEIDDFLRRNPGDDHRAVAALTNDTSDRDFDSQGPMYDQRTNSLNEAGRAATVALGPRSRTYGRPGSLASLLAPMPGRAGSDYVQGPGPRIDGGARSYPMPLGKGGGSGPFTEFTEGRSFPPGATPGDPVYLGGTGYNGGIVIGHYGPDGKPVYDQQWNRGPTGGTPVSTTMPVGGSTQLANLLRY
jgi:hypothetical protein